VAVGRLHARAEHRKWPHAIAVSSLLNRLQRYCHQISMLNGARSDWEMSVFTANIPPGVVEVLPVCERLVDRGDISTRSGSEFRAGDPGWRVALKCSWTLRHHTTCHRRNTCVRRGAVLAGMTEAMILKHSSRRHARQTRPVSFLGAFLAVHL
jgi:hypothetical protein